MTAGVTWRELAAARPEIMQVYIQEKGSLPDGPVTEKSWNEFRTWAQEKSTKEKK